MRTYTPWQRQKELQKLYAHEDVPDLEEINRLITSIEYGKLNPYKQTIQAKALIAILYLTAGRVSEIEGLTKNKLRIEFIDELPALFIRIINRKNRTKKTKKLVIPIEFEMDIYKHIETYLNTLQEEDVLFPFTKRRAIQIINETIGFNAHFIRHIRLTHLITSYDFKEYNLIKFAGWADGRPGKDYIELNIKDMFRAFYGGKKQSKGGN